MGAFHNALREEGTRVELIRELERQWGINADMLAALKAVLPTLEEREQQFGVESAPLRLTRAAIAKAEGRT